MIKFVLVLVSIIIFNSNSFAANKCLINYTEQSNTQVKSLAGMVLSPHKIKDVFEFHPKEIIDFGEFIFSTYVDHNERSGIAVYKWDTIDGKRSLKMSERVSIVKSEFDISHITRQGKKMIFLLEISYDRKIIVSMNPSEFSESNIRSLIHRNKTLNINGQISGLYPLRNGNILIAYKTGEFSIYHPKSELSPENLSKKYIPTIKFEGNDLFRKREIESVVEMSDGSLIVNYTMSERIIVADKEIKKIEFTNFAQIFKISHDQDLKYLPVKVLVKDKITINDPSPNPFANNYVKVSQHDIGQIEPIYISNDMFLQRGKGDDINAIYYQHYDREQGGFYTTQKISFFDPNGYIIKILGMGLLSDGRLLVELPEEFKVYELKNKEWVLVKNYSAKEDSSDIFRDHRVAFPITEGGFLSLQHGKYTRSIVTHWSSK